MSELNGFVYDMPMEEYRKVPALNGSAIIHMRRSPMQYLHALENPSPETAATRLGTATHKLILEPKTVLDFEVWGKEADQKVRRGDVWDRFQEKHAGKHIVTEGEWNSICDISSAANRHPVLSKYINAPGKTEVCMFWAHPYTKRRMKARIDKLSGNTIFDLKTTRDSRPFRFGPQAHSLGYVVKMALYAQGFEILTGKKPNVVLGAIESKAPHEGVGYAIDEDKLLLGLEELDKLIDRLTKCEKENHWPSEHETLQDLPLPAWASYEAETELELEV